MHHHIAPDRTLMSISCLLSIGHMWQIVKICMWWGIAEVEDMMPFDEVPSLDEFLTAPDSTIAKVAPPSMFLAVGGSRRAAALAGVPPHSDRYASYTREHMLDNMTRIFRHG